MYILKTFCPEPPYALCMEFSVTESSVRTINLTQSQERHLLIFVSWAVCGLVYQLLSKSQILRRQRPTVLYLRQTRPALVLNLIIEVGVFKVGWSGVFAALLTRGWYA
jgi:hypothetical protein